MTDQTILRFYEVGSSIHTFDWTADSEPKALKSWVKRGIKDGVEPHLIGFLTVFDGNEVWDVQAQTASDTARGKALAGSDVTVWLLLDDDRMPVADRKPTAYIVAQHWAADALFESDPTTAKAA